VDVVPRRHQAADVGDGAALPSIAVRAKPTTGGSVGNGAIIVWRVKPIARRPPVATSRVLQTVGVSNRRML